MRPARARPPSPNRSRPWILLLWLAAGLCLFLSGCALGLVSFLGTALTGGGVMAALRALTSPPFGGRQQVTVLVMGVDNIGRGLSDTLIVGSVQVPTRRVAALSIPRDSWVEVPGHGAQRINTAHPLGGIELTKATVEQLLGFRIDYYVEIGVAGLAQLVDAMGGIDVEVDRPMHYHDRRGHLHIDLQPGKQHLNGEQAMGYVRFRHDARGDLGRIDRQQDFLREVARQALQGDNLSRLPALAQAFLNTVHTDLTISDLLSLKDIVRDQDATNISMFSLTGSAARVHGASVLQLDPLLNQRIVNAFLFAAEPRVEVLNATGTAGLANRAAEKLRQAGMLVTTVGNSPRRLERSEVIDRIGRTDRSGQIARLLSCPEVARGQPDLNQPEITVILGSESSRLFGATDSEKSQPRP